MTSPASNSPCALVVDDNPLIRMNAADILEEAGFRVLEADHGDDAYELFKTRHSDVTLLFTDVQMPGTLDGFALARKVAMLWPHISLVVASGHVQPEPGTMPDKAKFIAKPFSVEMVHAHLQELLPVEDKPEPLRQAASDSPDD